MFDRFAAKVMDRIPAPEAEAHCDAPCGVYDPASARIAAEAVLSLTRKLLALEHPDAKDQKAHIEYHNTFARFVTIKEEQAQIAKDEVLILWTDYFKDPHLKEHPDLHDLFWRTAKLCSDSKQHVDEAKATQLLENVKKIHEIFWKTKKKDVAWYTAS